MSVMSPSPDVPTQMRRGLMLILSSPSGAGKSTLSRLLLERDPSIEMSVSVTTRPARRGEIDGVHYRFIDAAQFAELRDSGELLEWAEVFGNFYGTPRRPVEVALQSGRDILFDIDWQGTQQLAQRSPKDLVSIFVLPPSGSELAARLQRRAQDSPPVVARRMAAAASEISHWAEYDYVVVNCDLERCLDQVRTILAAERLRRERRPGLPEFVRSILSEL
jgi:guanylate kinase